MFEGAHGGPQLLLLVVVGAGVTLCARMGVATGSEVQLHGAPFRSESRSLGVDPLSVGLFRRIVALCSASSWNSALSIY
jgi:hypothetical protein